jgi:hypothetical protein
MKMSTYEIQDGMRDARFDRGYGPVPVLEAREEEAYEGANTQHIRELT